MTIVSEIVQIQTTTAYATAYMICTCAVSAAFAISYVGGKYLESAARQPEIASQLFTRLLLIAGLIDVVPILGVGVSLLFTFISPFTSGLITLLPQLT